MNKNTLKRILCLVFIIFLSIQIITSVVFFCIELWLTCANVITQVTTLFKNDNYLHWFLKCLEHAYCAFFYLHVQNVFFFNIVMLFFYSCISSTAPSFLFIKISVVLLLLIAIRAGLPRFRYDFLTKAN